MDGIDEITGLLSGGSRVIIIAEREVDLRPQAGDNRLLLLKIAEGSLASGGRGGGFGERRVVMARVFDRVNGLWSKVFESDDEAKAQEFEVPYHVSRLPFTLSDGSEAIGYGVVEPGLVQGIMQKAGVPSSP